jgi:hypothetical protein
VNFGLDVLTRPLETARAINSSVASIPGVAMDTWKYHTTTPGQQQLQDAKNYYSNPEVREQSAAFGVELFAGAGLSKFTKKPGMKPAELPKAKAVVSESAEQGAKGGDWDRLSTVGRTPGKSSATGQKVIDQMAQQGKIMDDPVFGKMFMDSKGEWRQMKFGDMSHKTDAVSWWNSTGRNYGAKAPEVRKWMLDPDNYVIDYYKINRSAGGKLTERYLPPLR